MYFRIIIVSCLVAILGAITQGIFAQTNPVVIEVLSREECPHCQAEKSFLESLSSQRNDFSYSILDLTESDNLALWEQITTQEKLPKVTPITIVGETVFLGFGTEETTGVKIIELIEYYSENPTEVSGFQDYIDLETASEIEKLDAEVCAEECVVETEDTLSRIPIPFVGTVNMSKVSLPVLAATLGFIDGFNPCAMWVLITFLLILAQLKSRRKMIVYAGLFIIAEAIMYTLILTVWYTTWDFVGLDRIVTPLVGLLAIGGGLFFLYEWKTSDPGECKVTNLNQRQKIRQRIQSIVHQPLTLTTCFGIILIAFSVNVIEFACSIGIPQTFTKIIELNQLGFAYSAWLIAVYITMYMVDDFIVFGLALYSFEKIGLTSKYSKITNFVGGLLLLLLGAILILNPGILRSL